MNSDKMDQRITSQTFEAILQYANALEAKQKQYESLPGGVAPDALKALEGELIDHACRIVVTGEFKRGKSSFIRVCF
jgi:hypothetical protein